MARATILIVKCGSTHPDVARAAGDYDAWFVDALVDGAARCTIVRASEDEALPPRGGFSGIVLSGSPASVRDELPWMDRLAGWALDAAEHGTPVLGVCFGHQLLGEALGGRVEPSSGGYEGGTIDVELTPEGREDPLFAGLPGVISVQATHADALVKPPRGVRLAGNEHTTWQAFAAGPRVRGVQFHPELRADVLATLLRTRGRERPVRASVHGARVLQNWDETFVRGS